MAISALENTEDFDQADDMLDRQAFTRQLTIGGLCRRRQGMMFGGLFWRLRQCMAFLNTLITSISLDLRFWMNMSPGLLEQREVMCGTATGCGADDLAREGMDEQLRLYGVTLFLPAVPLFLFF